MQLYVSVQARNQEYDYAAVAAQADGVVLMNYDEHYPSPGTAGPVASQDWFTDNLKAAIKVVPRTS
jgi:spore germination protein YaaH